jgi:hypothetical protein
MPTLHVASFGPLAEGERQLIAELAGATPIDRFDTDPAHMPRFYYAGGPSAWVPLSWLVVTFLGAGAAISLKAFLQELGKEAGKRLIEHLFTKEKEQRAVEGETRLPALPALVIVYEPQPRVIAVVRPLSAGGIVAPPDELFTTVGAAVGSLPTDKGAVIHASFSNGRWTVGKDLISNPLPIVWNPERGIFEVAE